MTTKLLTRHRPLVVLIMIIKIIRAQDLKP